MRTTALSTHSSARAVAARPHPLRARHHIIAPSLRIPDRFMKSLRQGLMASGCEVTPDPDAAFIVGRHPC